MKITHIALCGPVTDHMTYQDNLLPKFHKKMNFEVSMITSKYIWDKGFIGIDYRDKYKNEYGIKTIRLESKFSTNINSKLKLYKNLYEVLLDENPDILFIHGVQFLNIIDIIKYVKMHAHVKIFVDNHADFSNSARTWLSKNILHKILWRKMAKMIEPYTTKFYGVLPARVKFLEDIYKLPIKKLDLLLMGADDEKVSKASYQETILDIKRKYNLEDGDFIIVTGGKIDHSKRQILNLMKSVDNINDKRIKLIVFGSVDKDLEQAVFDFTSNHSIQYIGWINDEESYKLFAAANLMVFPGRHSVYWEQVVALGRPLIVKYWEGTTHIDIKGNCQFLYEDTEEEMTQILKKVIYDQSLYKEMLEAASSNLKETFLYSNIAKRSIS